MLVIANLILIVYLIAMAYWWGLQGFFSAFLHLIVTIVAATLAFAVWEPLVLGFLFDRMPEYAWGVGLLAPFLLLMPLLRFAMDYFVKKNVHFHQIINLIAGGFCGVLSGILISGVALIGLQYLPLGLAVGGYQPIGVETSGRTVDTGQTLWISVDRQAGGFFTKLSGGTFSAGRPMTQYRPALAEQAAQFRLQRHYDPNASLIATPQSVQVTQLAIHKAPPPGLPAATLEALGGPGQSAANKVVAVETRWEPDHGVFDGGATLYLPPVQIRLATEQGLSGNKTVKLHQPVAFSRLLYDGRVEMTPITSDRISANSSDQRQTITWTFVVPADATPTFLFARQLRLPLPTPANEAPKLAALLGEPAAAAPPADPAAPAEGESPTVDEGEVGPREGPRTGSMPLDIEADPGLPAMFSKNVAQGLTIQDNAVVSGRKEVPPTPSTTASLRVDKVWHPSHQRVVRVKIGKDQAYSIYGGSIAAAASLQQPVIEDNRGQIWEAIGYAWEKAGGSQQIVIDRSTPIRSAKELPISQMGPNDTLYLYFVVNVNTRIVKYWYGRGGTGFECNVPVE